VLLADFGRNLADKRNLQFKFLREPDERDHDLRLHLDAFFLHLDGGLEHGPGLHR
jgi:hypothetical protein